MQLRLSDIGLALEDLEPWGEVVLHDVRLVVGRSPYPNSTRGYALGSVPCISRDECEKRRTETPSDEVRHKSEHDNADIAERTKANSHTRS